MTLYEPPARPAQAKPAAAAALTSGQAGQPAPAAPAWPKVQAMIDQAEREGRHSDRFKTVCEGCSRWVPAIWHVTVDGRRICRRCYGEDDET